MKAVFSVSIAVIILHKMVSCGAVYTLTKDMKNVFLQFIDFMMIKAIYLNYKLNTDEPGNAQRYLQILEGTFESAPQILISILFITKTYNPGTGVDPIILISVISSIWTVTSRVTSDDKLILKPEWKSIFLDGYKFPYIHHLNKLYFVRVIFWRLFEISSRVFILVLFWISVGGFALIIVMGVELVLVLILCVNGEGVIVLGNMMYFTMAAVGSINKTWLNYAAWYRFTSPFIMLLLITIFATTPFETWKVPDYVERQEVVGNALNLLMLIYSWTTTIIQLISIQYIIYNGKSGIKSVRAPDALLLAGEWIDLLNLIEFGSPVGSIYPSINTSLIQTENVLLYMAKKDSNNMEHAKMLLFKKLCESNRERSIQLLAKSDAQDIARRIGWDVPILKYLLEEFKIGEEPSLDDAIQCRKDKIVKYLVKDYKINAT